MTEVTLHLGLPAGLEHAAATLYWQAFGDKLGLLLGPSDRAIGLFMRTINPGSIIAATQGGTLLGITAFYAQGPGFSSFGWRDLIAAFGIGALWRLLPLSMLERNPPEGLLQMDGICVAANARGKGVGTALLEALFDYARSQGLQGVTLDVIDTNPRARALYEKIGFEAVGIEHTSLLRPLLGFRSSTKMTKRF